MIRKLGAVLIVAVVGLALAVPVLADHIEVPHQTDNCAFDKETQFKLDVKEGEWEPSDPGIDLTFTYSDEDEPVDVSAPDGWTILCAKVPQPDKGAGISHVVVERDEQSTTTTTQPNETTTTTVEETTTTTEGTTTTAPPAINLPCVVDCGPPDSIPKLVPDPAPVVTTPVVTTPTVLPFTGPSDYLPAALVAAIGMFATGGYLARRFRDRLDRLS